MIKQISFVLSLFPLLVSCIGCSTTANPPDVPLSRIEPGLKPIVNQFIKDCKRLNPKPETCTPYIKLTVRVIPTDENTLGVCFMYNSPYEYVRDIHINPETTLNETLLTVVLYHELMHCVLGYRHYDTQLDIMNSYLANDSSSYFLKYFDFFLKLVFDREARSNE